MRTDFGYVEEKDIGKPYDVKLLRRLYPFVRPYKLMLFCSVFLVVLITLLDLSLPYITKVAIDRHIVPMTNSAAGAFKKDEHASSRYLKIDLDDEKVKAIVQKHAGRFEIHDTFALIDYKALAGLPKKDLLIIRHKDMVGLTAVAALFLLLVVANFGLNFIQVMVMETNGQRIMHDLRQQLFEHVQQLSVDFFSRNPLGRLVTRVTNDVQNMHELFTSIIVFIFKDLFLLVGITIALLSINMELALVSFTVIPFVIYASFKFSTHAREAFRTLRIKIAEINSKISETIGGMSVIQLFGKEQENYGAFKTLNHDHYRAGMRQIEIFAVFMPVIELLGVIALAIVILYGGSGVLSGSISLGALVAFISYVKMFFRPIRDIAEKYNILQNAMASAERIFLVLDSDEKLPSAVDRSLADRFNDRKISTINFDSVSFSYVSGEPVLKQINLDIRAGDVVAVVGPTGSGKTSLINLLPRFYDPSEGRIMINGFDIRHADLQTLRAKIALVTQDPFLFSVSIRENINPGRRELSDDEMAELLEASNCKGLVERLPDGLDTVLAEGGASISSGERQLLSIARAFAHDPELIILDEATSYIDSETEQKIQAALANLMENRTTIMVAHRLTTARNADKIVVLHHGRIIESGSHQKLMQQNGFYARLTRLQG